MNTEEILIEFTKAASQETQLSRKIAELIKQRDEASLQKEHYFSMYESKLREKEDIDSTE